MPRFFRAKTCFFGIILYIIKYTITESRKLNMKKKHSEIEEVEAPKSTIWIFTSDRRGLHRLAPKSTIWKQAA